MSGPSGGVVARMTPGTPVAMDRVEMKTYMRKTLMQLATSVLLSSAGIAAAQEAPPAFDSTGCRRTSDKVYSFYDEHVTAAMRFGETYASVTTQLEGSATSWHLVSLMINCSDNGGSYRTYAWLNQARTVKLYCPNAEGFPPEYFVTGASAMVDDIDDSLGPDEEQAEASTRVEIEDPGPGDSVPPRSSSSGNQPGGGDSCDESETN